MIQIKFRVLMIFFVLFYNATNKAQTIKGNFKQAKFSEIVLNGFVGFNEKELAKTTTDSLGTFILDYPKDYVGAAILKTKDKSLILLLNLENFEVYWSDFQDFNSLEFKNSIENQWFTNGFQINQEIEQKLAGLHYLEPLYKNQEEKWNWIKNEIKVQETIFDNYLETLPENSYAKDYLRLRKILGDIQITNKNYKDLNRIVLHKSSFKSIDFNNDALWHSGLLSQILNQYYQLLELYKSEDLISKEAIETNTIWLKKLENNTNKQQELATYCFSLLESKFWTKASEHIALAMLNKTNCDLSNQQINLFEQYRKLAIGAIAPPIVLNNSLYKNKDIKSLPNKYKLIAFGASWCPSCQTDYPSLIGRYKKLKEQYDIEFIYISIDTNKIEFENYYKEAPFWVYCDFKGWNSNIIDDYHIFNTPTYFLVDSNMKILAKPIAPEAIEYWLKKNIP